MPKKIEFDIIDGYSKEEHGELDPQETINWFYVQSANGKKALFPTPGLSLNTGTDLSNIIDGGGRLFYNFKENEAFAVIKDRVFIVNITTQGISAAEIGEINTEKGYVGVADNGKEVLFVDGVNGWVYDSEVGNFSKVTDPNFPSQPVDVTILANRFIVQKGEDKLWFYSNSGSATIWNVLNFNSFDNSTPDVNVSCATLNKRLFIMGEKSTEPWYVSGAPIDPYRPSDPAFEFGCASAGSVVSAFGVLVWLSKTKDGVSSVVATTGGQPQPISTQSIETEFEKYSDVSDAKAFMYKNEVGHIIYQINFTIANASWMYDFSTKKWSKLEYEAKDRHLAQDHVYLNGKHYVLDYKEAKIYELSNQYHDDNGVKIRRLRVSSILEAPPFSLINLNSVRFKLKQGTGLDCGIEEEPVLFLSLSHDEGDSYGNKRTAEIGRIGRRTWRTIFDRCGSAESFVFKLEHYQSVHVVVLNAGLNFDVTSWDGGQL